MEEKYYVQVSIPHNIGKEIIRRRNKVLTERGYDLTALYLKKHISNVFHWTIKAPFVIKDRVQYLQFKRMVMAHLREVRPGIIRIGSMRPPFGNWSEEVVRAVGTLPQMQTMALEVGCPSSLKEKTLSEFQYLLVIECFFERPEFYCELEQFNNSHVSILSNLQNFPLEEMQCLYEALSEAFEGFNMIFEPLHVEIMKKGPSGWILEEKLTIPFSN